MALYESLDEPGLFCEFIAYSTAEDLSLDQLRIEQDEHMKMILAKWHSYFAGPLEVRRLAPVSI